MRMFAAAVFIFLFFFMCKAVSVANIFPYSYDTGAVIGEINQTIGGKNPETNQSWGIIGEISNYNASNLFDAFGAQAILAFKGMIWFGNAFVYSTFLLPKFLMEEWYFPYELAMVIGIGINMIYLAGLLQFLLARGFKMFR
ncbi:hypothetical protein CW703_05310 [Candidatus Bathyarchaeota archaeon]|nr:MAG: hypothetical protein CW703_05310 [Candidatus Bathyarchaeota archaeon]